MMILGFCGLGYMAHRRRNWQLDHNGNCYDLHQLLGAFDDDARDQQCRRAGGTRSCCLANRLTV